MSRDKSANCAKVFLEEINFLELPKGLSGSELPPGGPQFFEEKTSEIHQSASFEILSDQELTTLPRWKNSLGDSLRAILDQLVIRNAEAT